MFLEYTPLRKIIGGAGEINHNLSKYQYKPKEESVVNTSLSGKTEGILNRIDDVFEVKTQPIARADLGRWREWYASTAASEVFVIDADDTATKAAPVDAISAIRLPKTYQETQEGILFVISFKIKRVY